MNQLSVIKSNLEENRRMLTNHEQEKFKGLKFVREAILVKAFRSLDFEKTEGGVYDPKYKNYVSDAGRTKSTLDRDSVRLSFRALVVTVPARAKMYMDKNEFQTQPVAKDIVWVHTSAFAEHHVFLHNRDKNIVNPEGYYWLHPSNLEAIDTEYKGILESDFYDKEIETEELILKDIEEKRKAREEEAAKLAETLSYEEEKIEKGETVSDMSSPVQNLPASPDIDWGN